MISDRDRISTRQLNRLRRRILRVYGTARREMQKQLTEFLAKYKALDERKRAQLDAGEITEDDYRIWLQNQVFQSDLMHAKLDGITQTCTTAQETAYKLARDEQYNIFSFGANWAFYELEQAAGVTFGLTLYNTEAVKLLLKENPRMVPNKRIKSESNRTYDARVFNRYVMQGIVQGKSVHDIAVQAVNGMADTEIHWAMNNAITALTSAQNAGALQQMRNARDLGIEVKSGGIPPTTTAPVRCTACLTSRRQSLTSRSRSWAMRFSAPATPTQPRRWSTTADVCYPLHWASIPGRTPCNGTM